MIGTCGHAANRYRVALPDRLAAEPVRMSVGRDAGLRCAASSVLRGGGRVMNREAGQCGRDAVPPGPSHGPAARLLPRAVPALAGVVVFVAAHSGGADAVGALLLAAPYLLLALTASGDTRAWAWTASLVLLVAMTAVGLLVAGTSSTGGLVFIWIVPLQLLIATGVLAEPFRTRS